MKKYSEILTKDELKQKVIIKHKSIITKNKNILKNIDLWKTSRKISWKYIKYNIEEIKNKIIISENIINKLV